MSRKSVTQGYRDVTNRYVYTYNRTIFVLNFLQRPFGENTATLPEGSESELATHFQPDQGADKLCALVILSFLVRRIGRQIQILDVLEGFDVRTRFGHFALQQVLDDVLLGVQPTQAAHYDWLL